MNSTIPAPGVAVLGCGTVGGATAQFLYSDEALIQERSGVPIRLKYIVDLDFSHARSLGLPESTFTSDLDAVLADPEVGIVVETVGGLTTAKDFFEKALKAGKHVVTANKALLAHHGPELMAVARENGTALSFEASCGGGIPVIRALTDGLLANRIDALYGILNGTCNFILTEMAEKGKQYEDALADAQSDGLAEADPTLDVSGMDTAHKITIMASLAFGRRFDLESVPVEGIDTLDLMDVKFGAELGYVAKLLAVAERKSDGFSLRVRPAFISTEHPLAWIRGPFNAASIYGHRVGHTMYYGRGAGGSPTASAVVADIISAAHGIDGTRFHTLGLYQDRNKPEKQLPAGAITGRYYIRAMVFDRPGVLGTISSILGNHNISISSFLQKEPPEAGDGGRSLPIVITTHKTREEDLNGALEEVNKLEIVDGSCTMINIVDERPENLS